MVIILRYEYDLKDVVGQGHMIYTYIYIMCVFVWPNLKLLILFCTKNYGLDNVDMRCSG